MQTREKATFNSPTNGGSIHLHKDGALLSTAPASPPIHAEAALAIAQEQGHTFLLTYLGIDDLKSINDLWGYQTGNQVLDTLTSRLNGFCFEGAMFSVVGQGGDDFILYGSVPAGTEAFLDRFSRYISEVVGEEMLVGGNLRRVPVSIGISASTPRSSVGAMLLEARSTLVLGGRDRRGSTVVCDRSQPNSAELIRALPAALEDGQIHCHYQPTIDVTTGKTVHVEALARWTTPTGQTISPAIFVPIVEAYGLASELTATVLGCVHDFILDERTPSATRVWVNVSPYETAEAGFAERFLRSLATAQVPPHRVGVELTESAAVGDPRRLGQEFRILQHRGVRVAIDDFGSGYSPLGHLAELSADLVKLDRSLVSGIDTNVAKQHMVAGLAGMLAKMGAEITVEGVERPGEQAWLLAHGLCHVQGFLWARPCPQSSFDWSIRPHAGSISRPLLASRTNRLQLAGSAA